MKLALISLKSKSSELIEKEAKKFFSMVDMLNLKDIEISVEDKDYGVLHQGKPIEKYDCVYCRGSHKYALLLKGISEALYGKCYMPLAPQSFTIGHDKLLTSIELQKHKVAIPKTFIAGTTKAAKSILNKIHYPAIIKIPSGTHGKGVMFADSIESGNSMLDALEVFKQPYILQEYVETGATDVRALVVGDSVIASVKRKAIRGELRANIHQGAISSPIILDYDTRKLAIKSAKALNAEICAVDLLQGVKSLVIEVNVSPGLQGITEATKKNVAKEIVEYLYDRTKAFKQEEKSKGYDQVLKELEIGNGKKDIITNLDIKAGRIKLPEVITKITKFDSDEEVLISLHEGKLVIKKHK